MQICTFDLERGVPVSYWDAGGADDPDGKERPTTPTSLVPMMTMMVGN